MHALAVLFPAVALIMLYADAVGAQEDFLTDTGICTFEQIEALQDQSGDFGRTFAIAETDILTNRGATAAPSGTRLPALTPVACHAETDNLVLVSSEGDAFFCGWVERADLLPTRPREGLFATQGTCGEVAAMPVADFCERMGELGENTETCVNRRLINTVFDTKFIVDNTSLGSRPVDNGISHVEIPLYNEARSNESSGAVNIFNVLRIYDVARGPENALRYLLGVGNRRLLGWIDAGAGAVWYSKLATFFASDSDGVVLSGPPWVPKSRIIAAVPSDLEDMLASSEEFQRYPVLMDERRIEPNDPPAKVPYLEIAFIGAFCGDGGTLCSEIKEQPVEIPYDLLNSADIMFLIDGTKSMNAYFRLVARAVDDLASEFAGNLDYQFGVAVYGDFIDPSSQSSFDPMQFRQEVALTPIFDGTEFALLPDTSLFVQDALADKPEAANSALLRTILEIPWRGTAPKFIIHIADHGDRKPPDAALFEALEESQVFYLPIAVKGEEILPASQVFVEHANILNANHRTPGGATLALPPAVTYEDLGGTTEQQEYRAIYQALSGAVRLGEEVRDEVIDELFAATLPVEPSPESPAPDRFPEGFSELTQAAIELYIGEIENVVASDVTARTIAARGTIATTSPDRPDTNWDFYAAIQPGDLTDLARAFEDTCVSMSASDAIKDVENTVRTMIEIFTGDSVTDAELPAYFADRDEIPLSSQTLLGEGIFQVVDDLSNPNAEERIVQHQKEFCRTAALLKLMQAQQRLEQPFETRDGVAGDLVWRPDSATYTYRDAESHNWILSDSFNARTIFVPLSYMPSVPGPRAELQTSIED